MVDDPLSFLGSETEEPQNGKWSLTFTAFYRDTPEAINNLKQRFVAVQNALGCSKTRAVTRIFEAGLAAMERENHDKLDPMRAAFARKRQELEQRRNILEQLTAFYGQMSLEEFLAFCEESRAPEDLVGEFLAGYTWQNTDQRWATRAHDFLRQILASGEPLDTKTIRATAVDAEIIADTPDEWARMRALASRNGLTNCPKHGHWQLKTTL